MTAAILFLAIGLLFTDAVPALASWAARNVDARDNHQHTPEDY